jgi:hypothetical protein
VGFHALAHVVDEGAAAGFSGRKDDLDAAPRQEADGGVVDARVEDRLGAAPQQRHPALTAAHGGERAWPIGGGAGR